MKKISLFFLSILFTYYGFSQTEFKIGKKPSWVENSRYEIPETIESKNKDAGVIYLLYEYQSNLNHKADYYHTILKVTSEIGVQEYSEKWVTYEPSYQKVIFHELYIIRDGKKINKLDRDKFKIIQNETDLHRHIYNGTKSAGIYLEDVRKGDIIEASFTIQGQNPIYNNHYFNTFLLQYDVPILDNRVTIIAPEHKNLYFKHFNCDPQFEKEIMGAKKYYRWTVKNEEQLVFDSNLPIWYNPYKRVQVSEFMKWEDVVDWSLNYYPKKPKLNNKLKSFIADIQNQKTDLRNKIDTLIRFVQDEIRYVGIEIGEYSHKPRTPNEVYEKRYGDCKDKSYLLATLLENIGISADICLVNSYYRGHVDEYAPSPLAFNHAIACFTYKDKLYFVDPTITLQRGSFLDEYIPFYNKGLIIKEGTERLVDIDTKNSEKIEFIENITSKGVGKPALYNVTAKYYGGEANTMRYNFASSNQEDINQHYVNSYSTFYSNLDLRADIKTIDDTEDNRFVVYESYSIPDFWADFNNTAYKTAKVGALNLFSYLSQPEDKIRKMPFGIYHPIQIHQKITYLDDEGISIGSESGRIENRFFKFEFEYSSVSDRKIVFDYKYESKADFVPSEDVKKYLKDINEVIDYLEFDFTSSGISSNNSGEPKSYNMLLIALTLMFAAIVTFFAIKAYKRNTKNSELINYNQPRNIGGWLVLPIIGLCITPLVLTFHMFNNEFFDLSVWNALTDSSSPNYHPLWGVVIMFELLLNTLFIAFSILLIVLAFKRRNIFPLYYIIFRVSNLVLVTVDFFIVSMIDESASSYISPTFQEIAKSMIGAAIWIPYMILSVRVKETFTVPYPKSKKTMEPDTPDTELNN